jgi:hypothetical protein
MGRRGNKYNGSVTWEKMVMVYGQYCAYCMEEPAQTIDHIIPWSHSYCDEIWNLRPCCLWCNLHAGDKYFETFEDKQEFLKNKRYGGRSNSTRTVCTTCFLPYQRPHMTTSMFECPECDPSKCKRGSQQREWESFKRVMTKAGIHIPLHDEIRILRQKQEINKRGAQMQIGEAYLSLQMGESDSTETLSDLMRWHVLAT